MIGRQWQWCVVGCGVGRSAVAVVGWDGVWCDRKAVAVVRGGVWCW